MTRTKSSNASSTRSAGPLNYAEGAEEEFERCVLDSPTSYELHTFYTVPRFRRYCAEATFRIGILEQRLEPQEALVARKYQELERRLQVDPRLAVIYGGSSTAAIGGAARARDAGRR